MLRHWIEQGPGGFNTRPEQVSADHDECDLPKLLLVL